MPSDRERGGLVGLKRPLVSAEPVTDPVLERTILPPDVTERDSPTSRLNGTDNSSRENTTAKPQDELNAMADQLTKPATFHLPIALLKKLRATCRLKDTTMVEFVRQAIEEALRKQRPTHEDIDKLLGG